MSPGADSLSPARGRRPRAGIVTVSLLACVLAALLAHLLVGGEGGSHRASLAGCVTGAPEVSRVAPARLGALRASVARVLPQRVGRLYEEGTVVASDAWSDDSPEPPPVSATAPRHGGYEMRWWAPNGDDVAADVFVFATAGAAQRFLALAGGPRCRAQARPQSPTRPPFAREVSWINPDGAAEADLYLARGTRVYRIADAPGQQSPATRLAGLARAFGTIELLACLLPGAKCSLAAGGVPT